MKHRCNQVLELGLPLREVAKLFAQEWEGDVTIVMPATIAQVSKILVTIYRWTKKSESRIENTIEMNPN